MRRCWWLLVIGFWFLISGVRAAPLAVGQAYLDWSQLTIRTLSLSGGSAPSITWNKQEEQAEAWADEDYHEGSLSSWGALNVSASMGGASAYASLNSTAMEVYSDPEVVGYSVWSGAHAERFGSFTVNGTGLVAIGVPYTLRVSLGSSSASADASVSLRLTDVPPGDESLGSEHWSSTGATFWKSGDTDGVGIWTDSGWLWVSLYFEDGETGYFTATLDTSASSPVPLPGTLLLLGSGLLGLSLRRRKWFPGG